MMSRKACLIAISAAVLIAAGAPSVLIQKEARAQAVNSSVQASDVALSDFASEVETLGVEKYPDSFAGAALTPTGATDVYLTSPSDPALVAAVNALNTSGYPVSFVNVSRSYNQLDALVASVTAKDPELMGDGIDVTQAIPEPSTGTVSVNFAEPSGSSISALATASGRSVTADNYSTSAGSVLQQLFGSSVTLGQERAAAFPADRNSDTAPFYDGDRIYRTGDVCTGGWNVWNNSHQPFMITAGHCGTSTWSTGAETIGPTSSNWWTSSTTEPYPSTLDAQAVKINDSRGGLGAVWTSGPNVAPVTGSLVPALYTYPTINGSLTGERHDGEVYAVDTTVKVCDSTGPSSPPACYIAVHQILASNNTNNKLCYNSDSGGPTYQQYSGTTAVKAEGVIGSFGYFTNGPSGPIIGWECNATMITSIMSDKSLTLITSTS